VESSRFQFQPLLFSNPATSPQTRPVPGSYQTKWLMARLAGKPFKSERWFVEASGKIDKTPL
jgi:hypothetical protein